MTSTRRLLALLAFCLGLIAPVGAGAHSALRSSDPPSGSVLSASPSEIVLTFNETVSLSSVSVTAKGVSRSLSAYPRRESDEFTIDEPALAAGRNELRWKAISADGHPVEGVIILNIRP